MSVKYDNQRQLDAMARAETRLLANTESSKKRTEAIAFENEVRMFNELRRQQSLGTTNTGVASAAKTASPTNVSEDDQLTLAIQLSLQTKAAASTNDAQLALATQLSLQTKSAASTGVAQATRATQLNSQTKAAAHVLHMSYDDQFTQAIQLSSQIKDAAPTDILDDQFTQAIQLSLQTEVVVDNFDPVKDVNHFNKLVHDRVEMMTNYVPKSNFVDFLKDYFGHFNITFKMSDKIVTGFRKTSENVPGDGNCYYHCFNMLFETLFVSNEMDLKSIFNPVVMRALTYVYIRHFVPNADNLDKDQYLRTCITNREDLSRFMFGDVIVVCKMNDFVSAFVEFAGGNFNVVGRLYLNNGDFIVTHNKETFDVKRPTISFTLEHKDNHFNFGGCLVTSIF